MRLFGRKKAGSKLSEVLKGVDPPGFPQQALQLLKLLRDPNAQMEQIVEALNWDPGLVLRILKLVNSAAYGARRKIDNVSHAVSMLGRAPLEQLVLGVVVKDNLPKPHVAGFEPERFWNAAFFRAALARSIAHRLHPADEARSFTGGLLQDMAVPMLASARPEEYGPILVTWHENADAQLHVLERARLGVTHDELGGHLGAFWELPDSLTSTIGNHHRSEATDWELPPALKLVSLHRETEVEHGMEALLHDGKFEYGLEPDWLRKVLEESAELAKELAGVLK